MNARTTIVLLLIALGLYLFIRLFEAPTTREAAERRQYVAQIERDNIDGIVISASEREIELVRKDNEWRMQKPVSDRADSMTVDQLLGSVENLQRENTIKLEKDEQLSEFGLADSALRLKFRGKNAPPEFAFGADTAVEGKTYLRIGDAKEIHVVSNDLKEQLTKPPEEFRDRSLTDLSVSQIDRVIINMPSGQIELHREAEHWAMDKPLKARADDSRVNDLLAQTLTARIEKFIAGSKDFAQYGLAEPIGSVKFFSEEMDKPLELQIGAPADEENVYARLSNRESVYVVPKQAGELLNLNPNDLRERKLLRLNLDIVDRITIEGADVEFMLSREGEDEWTLNEQRPANIAMVKQLVNALQHAQITRFVAESASELEKYGLQQPQLKVRFSSFASENTAESEAGEQPVATVSFGKGEAEEVYARLEEEPYIVAVSKNVLHSIPLDSVQWRGLSVFDLPKKGIRSLNREGELPEIELNKDDDGSWKAAAGKIDETNLQSLLNTLASLRAVRWIGATDKSHGFENPALKLTFRLKDEQEHTLIVGGATSEKMYFATTGDGTFVLSQPDYSALQLPLLVEGKSEKSAPIAAPTPADARKKSQ